MDDDLWSDGEDAKAAGEGMARGGRAAAGGLVDAGAGAGGRVPARGHQRTDWCVTARRRPDWHGSQIPDGVVFYCGQQERGEGGFLHWQIFLQLDRRVRLHQVQSIIGDDTAHCEARRGTPAQARDYCRKPDTAVDGTFWEGGELRGPKVNHMDDLKAAMDGGADVHCLMHEHFGAWVRAEKACDRYIQARDALRASTWCPAKVELHWGDSGTGKTRFCMEYIDAYHGGISYRKPGGPWWDGYSRQSVVLFDDFDGGVPIDTLLQVLDGYGRGVLLPIKGSHINCWARTFLFTSNKDLDQWYPNAAPEQRAGLRRRFSLVRQYRQGDPLVKVEPPQVIELE